MMGPCEVMFIRGRGYSEGWNGCGVCGLSGLLSRVRWGIGCEGNGGDFGAGEHGERRSGRAQMGVRYGANGALCGATAPVRGGWCSFGVVGGDAAE